MTKSAKDRTYHVLMYALSEEIRIAEIPREEAERRAREIWESCYGEDKAS